MVVAVTRAASQETVTPACARGATTSQGAEGASSQKPVRSWGLPTPQGGRQSHPPRGDLQRRVQPVQMPCAQGPDLRKPGATPSGGGVLFSDR